MKLCLSYSSSSQHIHVYSDAFVYLNVVLGYREQGSVGIFSLATFLIITRIYWTVAAKYVCTVPIICLFAWEPFGGFRTSPVIKRLPFAAGKLNHHIIMRFTHGIVIFDNIILLLYQAVSFATVSRCLMEVFSSQYIKSSDPLPDEGINFELWHGLYGSL